MTNAGMMPRNTRIGRLRKALAVKPGKFWGNVLPARAMTNAHARHSPMHWRYAAANVRWRSPAAVCASRFRIRRYRKTATCPACHACAAEPHPKSTDDHPAQIDTKTLYTEKKVNG